MSFPSSNYLLSSLPPSSTPVILYLLCGSHKEHVPSAYPMLALYGIICLVLATVPVVINTPILRW